MKRPLILLTLSIGLAYASCGTIGKVNSTTYIPPLKSFELGNGQHGSFTAQIRNASAVNIEILTRPLEGKEKSVAVLKPNEKIRLSVEGNAKAIFKNSSPTEATLELVLEGDTGLSMGYKENK